MGRVIRREVVGIRCELRSCEAHAPIVPVPLNSDWQAQERQLDELVSQGWGLVLTPQLRSYCPKHVERAWQCSCRTNPDRFHLCPVHDEEVAALVRANGSPHLKVEQ